MGKRAREEGMEKEGDDGPSGGRPRVEKTIGMQTAHIKNKQRRSEVYGKLKHKAAVRAAGAACDAAVPAASHLSHRLPKRRRA
jgi:hypothetical protein